MGRGCTLSVGWKSIWGSRIRGLQWHWSEQLPSDSNASAEKQPAPLSRSSALRKIGGHWRCYSVRCGRISLFGRLVQPKALTPARFVDGFERVDGIHSGFRRNHAKGVGVSGYFESNGQGARLSKAVVFKPGRVPVIGRFSLAAAIPTLPTRQTGPRSRAFVPAAGWRRVADGDDQPAGISVPDAAGFLRQSDCVAARPQDRQTRSGKNGGICRSNPETVQALSIIRSHAPSSGFDNTAFNSLNAFWFINAAGKSIPVRWTLAPVQPFRRQTRPTAQADKNYIFDELIASILQHPLQWRLIVTIGQPGDPTNDATVAWPDRREQVDVGTLTLDHVESEETSPARDINFDPLVLPSGMAPSDDPLLSARSAVYSQSFTRRAGEAKTPSAISPAEVRK